MLRALFLIALLGSAPAFEAAAQPQLEGLCVIVDLDGAARVSAPGTGSRAAEVGLGLGRNAVLRTGDGARATLRCDGDLRVVVGPEAHFAVLRILDEAPSTVRLQLLRGIAGFIFGAGTGESEAEVQVRTPSAVAAVRSTEWAMRVTGGASAVFAREGDVFVFGETGSARLGPGDGVDVTAEGTLGAVVRWGQPRIDLFSELLGPDW
jgi:hypothetical protein